MQRTLLLFGGSLMALLLSPLAMSDTVLVYQKDDPAQVETMVKSNLPQNGINKAAVAKKFGEPVKKLAAVGEPPISRWDYGDYYVYFEHDLVLHSVAKPYMKAQLAPNTR